MNTQQIPNASGGVASTAVAPAQSGLNLAGPPVGAVASLRAHWAEYLIEAGLLGAFMVSACAFGVLYEYPGSPVRHVIESAFLRRVLMGLTMGATAILLIYSPWGKRSGAHFNPATTLTFLSLGRVRAWDGIFYIGFQTIGGFTGVFLASALIGKPIADPHVKYVITLGNYGPAVAFVAELLISFFLMTTVLEFIGHQKIASRTGLAAGALVAIFISLEAPYSGMSMNPARTVASAIPAGVWDFLWVYFTAPPLGMLTAAQVYQRRKGFHGGCAKLHHQSCHRCIFCGANGGYKA